MEAVAAVSAERVVDLEAIRELVEAIDNARTIIAERDAARAACVKLTDALRELLELVESGSVYRGDHWEHYTEVRARARAVLHELSEEAGT